MQPIQAQNDMVLAFSSPLLMRELPEGDQMNQVFGSMLKSERMDNPAPSTSSIEGWQSNTDLAVRDLPEIAILRDHIISAVVQLTEADLGQQIEAGACRLMVNAWGNIMDDGHMTDIHNHASKSDWSGVYYVDAEAGNPDVHMNGFLFLVDPRAIQVISGKGKYRQPHRHVVVKPINGSLIVFPGWMNHYVRTYRGETERISIAFNARIEWLDGPSA